MGGGGNRPNVNHGPHGNGNGRMKRPQNMLGRQFESSGPEGKVRGNALQLYERYKTAAREVQASDRILAESFSQFADHYYRLAAEYGAFDHDNDSALRRDDGFTGEAEPGNEQDVNPGEAEPEGREGASGDEQPSILAAEDGPSRSERHRFRNNADNERRDDRRRDGNDGGERRHMNGYPDPAAQPPVVLKQATPEEVKAPPAEAPVVRKPVAAEEVHAPAFLQVEAPRRKRGRPRKDEAAVPADAAPKLALDLPEPAAVAPAQATPVKATLTAKTAVDTPVADGTPAPRKRGRPRKNPVAAESA